MIADSVDSDMIEKTEVQIRDSKDSAASKAGLRVVSDRVAQSYASVLKSARQKNNLSTKDVAEALHVSRYVIEALESKRYEKLPAEIYVTGYIRGYASLLGLNPEGLVKDFRQDKEQCELTEATRLEQERISFEKARASKDPVFDQNVKQWSRQASIFIAGTPIFYKMIFVMVLIVPALLILKHYSVTDEHIPKSIDEVKVLAADGSMVVSNLLDNQHKTAIDGAALQSSETVKPVSELGKDKLNIAFNGTSWVTVRDFERVLLQQSRQQKGDVLELTGTAPFYVKISKASVVDIVFNEQKIDFSEQVTDDDQIHELPLLP